jgi:endo-1,4-beta-D-glucanase Y
MPARFSVRPAAAAPLLAVVLTTLLTACGGGSPGAPAPVTKAGIQLGAAAPAPLPYTAGTIRPNHLGEETLARQRLDFYHQWKALYVVQACGAGRYFVKVDADKKQVGGGAAKGSVTVSEAHGYGMLISVLMADEDSEARTVFDGMVRYFHDHPASSSPGLLAWNQVEGCQNAGGDIQGGRSATDGDLDIAYALLLAHSKWGSDGEINYKAEADNVLQAIMTYEVHPGGKHLLVGDWAGMGDDRSYEYTTRTSDFMLSHLNAFARASGDARWSAVQDRSYAIVDQLQHNFSAQTGLVPDFVAGLDGDLAPAAPRFLEGDNDGNYSWNASRFPWRVALDYLLYGDSRARDAMRPLTAWARGATGGDPARFAAGYAMDGTVTEQDYDALPFVSALGVSAMLDAGNQQWLNRIWDDVQARKLQDGDYYGNTLKLLGMITMSGRWAKP